MWNTDFSTLKPGEVFAIQGGLIGMAVAGGNLLRGFWIRPSGYILGSYESMGIFQVAREPDGSLIMADGSDSAWLVQTKAYWRLYNRYIRVPFAGWNWRFGSQESRYLKIGAEQISGMTDVERFRFERRFTQAVADGSIEDLARVWPASSRLSEFDMTTAFYNFYYLQHTEGSSRTKVTLADREEPVYVMRAYRNVADRWTGAERAWSCAGATLLTESDRVTMPEDGYLQMDCHISFEGPGVKELTEHVKMLEDMLGIRFAVPIRVSSHGDREFALQYHLEIPWKSLAPLLDREPTAWVADSLKTLLESETAVSQALRLPRLTLMTQLASIRVGQDAPHRAVSLLRTLVALGLQDPLFKVFLNEIPGEYATLRAFDQTAFSTETVNTLQSVGVPFESPLRDLYNLHFVSRENLVVNSF